MTTSRPLLCATVSLFVLATTALAASAQTRRPNVLLILSDDMGFSDLGCYGGEIPTPNLDALAAGGLRFTQFYNTARCCPTRASLLTGLYPHQAGIGHMMDDHGPDYPGFRGDLSPKCPTIAEALRPAGYRTYMVGKWHVTRHIAAFGPKHNWPLQRGFDRYYGLVSGGGSYYDPFTLCRDNRLISPFHDPEYRPDSYYLTDALSDTAIRFVSEHAREHASEPFFLYLAFTAAHWPMHAPADLIARHRGKYDAGYGPVRSARLARAKERGVVPLDTPLSPADADWDAVSDKRLEASYMEVYAAMVERMDQGIGRVVDELRRNGQFDDTLILFLQDNGGCAEDMGRVGREDRVDGPRASSPTRAPVPARALPDGLVPPRTRDGYPVRQGPAVEPGPPDTYVAYGKGWANVSNTPFREYKHWVHEGGISTPLIAHWPGHMAHAGGLVHVPGHLIDLMATCLDVAGATDPQVKRDRPLPAFPGRSLVPAFEGREIDREAIFWEHEGNRAIRRENWKLVARGPGAPWELYDIATDRTESRDQAAGRQALVGELGQRWESWARDAQVLPWIWNPAYPKTP